MKQILLTHEDFIELQDAICDSIVKIVADKTANISGITRSKTILDEVEQTGYDNLTLPHMRDDALQLMAEVMKNRGFEFLYEDALGDIGYVEDSDHAFLEEAKEMVQDYLTREFGDEKYDFKDLTHIPVAYTTSEDEQQEYQVYLDLIHHKTSYYTDGIRTNERCFDNLKEYVDGEICCLDFNELITEALGKE